MRVSKLYQDSQKPVISFEFFPPRDEKADQAFDKTLDALQPLNPDFMTMTFGAGGSTKDGSYQAVKKLMGRKIPTVAYLAGFGLGPDAIAQVLDQYKALGVETIFVIRGDKPRDKDFQPHPDSFPYASDLIRFIAGKYDFDLGCAGYPEGHIDAESVEKDIECLKLKVDNGAKYVVCQYCYDEDVFFAYVDKCRAAGIGGSHHPRHHAGVHGENDPHAVQGLRDHHCGRHGRRPGQTGRRRRPGRAGLRRGIRPEPVQGPVEARRDGPAFLHHGPGAHDHENPHRPAEREPSVNKPYHQAGRPCVRPFFPRRFLDTAVHQHLGGNIPQIV